MRTIQPTICLFVLLMTAAWVNGARAVEPNEFFSQSTVLPPGVLTVDDSLTTGDVFYADTVLGAQSSFGLITDTNDNGGPYSVEGGSALFGIPVNNNGTISFVISGFPDLSFEGSHDQMGDYQVYVDVIDTFGDVDASYQQFDTLAVNEVNQYFIPDINSTYTYDVFIDNSLGVVAGSDVDFFTFTGLTPGAAFSAETMELGFGEIDTFLGWFDDSGVILDTNDDLGPGTLYSLLEGIVPASGQLTFAVTGFGDEEFSGTHTEEAEYTLQLTIEGATLSGDFDGDGDVDGRDFLRWQRGGSPSPFSAADLEAWKTGYGPGSLSAVAAVPEPGTLSLLALAMSCFGRWRFTAQK